MKLRSILIIIFIILFFETCDDDEFMIEEEKCYINCANMVARGLVESGEFNQVKIRQEIEEICRDACGIDE